MLGLSRLHQVLVALVGLGLLAIFGCSSPPKWVEKGPAALERKGDKAFYGVGSVMGVKNEPLAWEAAQNRARADIIRVFQTYTAYLMRDYAASTTAGDLTRNTEEQNVERAIKTFAAGTLSGVREYDRYKDEKKEIYYVAVKLDYQEVKEQLLQAKDLNAEVRDFVRKNADRLFDRLEREEDRRR